MTKSEERESKIEALREQIRVIENEEALERQAKIAPFLKEHARLEYNSIRSIRVYFNNNEHFTQLCKLVDGPDSWSYHIGCPISENLSIRSDDGEVTLWFDPHTKFRISEEQCQTLMYKELDKLGLTLQFNDCIAQEQKAIDYHQTLKDGLVKIKKSYDDRKRVNTGTE